MNDELLDPRQVCEWLKPYMRGITYCNGQKLPYKGTDQRQYQRWRNGTRPKVASFDAFCTRYGLHIQEFFDWCDG